MSQAIQFDPIRLPREAEELRVEVRDFLAEEIANGGFDPHHGQKNMAGMREAFWKGTLSQRNFEAKTLP